MSSYALHKFQSKIYSEANSPQKPLKHRPFEDFNLAQ
jgi:hypothetical protein